MELNLAGVKALSSRTRIKILKEAHRQSQPTVTSLGEELNLSKSTVSAHLDILGDAELVERDEEDGRRRVIYKPTSTGKKLAKGRKVPVRLAALGLLSVAGSTASTALELFGLRSEDAGETGALAEEGAPRAADAAPGTTEIGAVEPVLLTVGIGLVALSVVAWFRPVVWK